MSRHSIDSFSLRFMNVFMEREDKKLGIASYLSLLATEALEKGIDVSKDRHKHEEIIKKMNGIKYVFNRKGEIRVLITIM